MPSRPHTHDCRVIAQAICTGYQDHKVTGFTRQMAHSGRPYIAIRVGRVLLYLEDREALTAFEDALGHARQLADRVFPLVEEQRQLQARHDALARSGRLGS